MGLFNRLSSLIRSNINELIDKAEDPEKMLNQALIDMKQQLIEAKKQVAVAIADEKRLKRQHEEEATKALEWERKAMLAVKAGDDNLARAALQRKAQFDETSRALGQQWEAQKHSVDQLKDALRALDDKIEEAKRKRNILVSRQKRAEAQRSINDTLSSLNSASSFDVFERMSDRVTQIEAEAEASSEFALPDASLDSQFRALEAGSGVDDQLSALKEKMALQAAEKKAISGGAAASTSTSGDGDFAGSAGAGSQGSAAAQVQVSEAELDAELEALKKKLSV